VSAAPQVVTTEFGHLRAVSRRWPSPLEIPGHNLVFPEFSTYLVDERTGRTLGVARWYAEDKAFVWELGGVSQGHMSDKTVPGGLTFEPDMVWANTQMFAFWYFRLPWEPSADVARVGPERAVGAGITAVFDENVPGCDVLSAFDGTVLRQCCERHDQCYGYDPQTNELTREDPCRAYSWLFLQGWRCQACNLAAIWCFLTGGLGGQPSDYPGPGPSSCDISQWGYCPPNCGVCNRHFYLDD
jgi:hypothetical protein